MLSKPPYVFMPIARFKAARSHRLNQVAPPNQFFGPRYRVFSCIEWNHTELFLALTWAAAVVSPSLGFTQSSRGAVRSRKVATAYRNRNIARLKKTEGDIAKLAMVRFITHVSFVRHYHLLTHKPAMSSPLVPRLGTRSRLPKPEPWVVQDSLEFVSLDS